MNGFPQTSDLRFYNISSNEKCVLSILQICFYEFFKLRNNINFKRKFKTILNCEIETISEIYLSILNTFY